MELILIMIVALVILGVVDQRLHPLSQPRPRVASRRTPCRRAQAYSPTRLRNAPAHRHSTAQVQPFLRMESTARH